MVVMAVSGLNAGRCDDHAMSRPSPQTDRVVAVIDLLADRAEGATMTEIATALPVNQATCVHLLAALTMAGFVVRDPADRRYHLGPALVRPGRLAEQHDPLLATTREEMVSLSRQFDLPCFAFAREADHARLVQITWGPGGPQATLRLGETIPLVPPLGIVFVAWSPEATFDHWLALDAGGGEGRADEYRRRRTAIRSLGFVAELAPEPSSRAGISEVFDDRASPYRDGQLHRLLSAHGGEEHLLTDLADTRPHQVTGISAPTFDHRGDVPLSLNLVTWDRHLSVADMAEISAAVRAATDRITRATGGRRPG